ncbi:MAG: UvrD-helicase domain-containing protein [Candidatus Paceibacterota bacterium]
MAKQGLKKQTETDDSLAKIISCLSKRKSFILEAGAGSGKTRSLIETLKHILLNEEGPLRKQNQQIVCITYTNVAKNEIIERIENNPLVLVGTIHQFAWHAIKNYQKELATEILEYNSKDTKKHISDLDKKIKDKKIEYSEYGRKFEEGQITHEDVIEFSNKLFEKYPKILKIVADKFPYIFIDEYQDTEERTVKMFLDGLLKTNESPVIGFFGDSMQNIYDVGIGQIPQEYIAKGVLELITKEENFRCSEEVIKVLNNIRTGLQQKPAGKNLKGEVLFVDCNGSGNIADYEKVKNFLTTKKGWDINKTKILLLTHKDIANKAGYETLLKTYDKLSFGRDRLFKKDEVFSEFILNKLEVFVSLYENKKYSEFVTMLGKQGFIVRKHEDKVIIDNLMKDLIKLRESTNVKEVIGYVLKNNLLVKPDRMANFEDKLKMIPLPDDLLSKKDFHDTLMTVNYKEFIQVNKYIEGSTPYSTKHGVKGAEFDNVLIVIDDTSWNRFNFNDVFSGNTKNQNRFNMTQNLLYVCCSRSKNYLAVTSLSVLDNKAIIGIKNIFGHSNYKTVDQL